MFSCPIHILWEIILFLLLFSDASVSMRHLKLHNIYNHGMRSLTEIMLSVRSTLEHKFLHHQRWLYYDILFWKFEYSSIFTYTRIYKYVTLTFTLTRTYQAAWLRSVSHAQVYSYVLIFFRAPQQILYASLALSYFTWFFCSCNELSLGAHARNFHVNNNTRHTIYNTMRFRCICVAAYELHWFCSHVCTLTLRDACGIFKFERWLYIYIYCESIYQRWI